VKPLIFNRHKLLLDQLNVKEQTFQVMYVHLILESTNLSAPSLL